MCSAPKAPKAPKMPKLPKMPAPPPPPPVPVAALANYQANPIRKTSFQRNAARMAARGPSALRIPAPKAT